MKYENWLFGKDGALFKAAATGKLELARELIADGANINAASSTGYTPIHRAAQNGHKGMVEFLLENGADAGVESKDNQTPLKLAIQNGHADVATILKKHSPE